MSSQMKVEHITEIKRLLSTSSSDCAWSTTDYDPLQQAIILNNKDAVIYCLMQKVYPDTYHPLCDDYLHLACKLGRESVVKTLLECRPEDFYQRGTVCYPNKCLHHDTRSPSRGASVTSKPSCDVIRGQLPLDIAVSAKQTACVHALVRGVSYRSNLDQISFLCDMDHPEALALFMKGSVHATEVKNAYQHCLLKKRDRCLQVLFDCGYSDFHIRGMNPYHILFQYASGFNRHLNRHDNLCATVSCLLRKGIDIHQCRPAGSYPLYSLLDYIMKDCGAYGEEYYSDSVSRELLSCLKLLLRQGVRMDLDEIFVSLSRKDEQEPVAFGRDLFKSVFDVVSSNAESALNISIGSSELIKDCVNILLSQTHRVILKPSNLTGLIKLLVRAGYSRSICQNLESVIYRLLCEGIPVSTPMQLPYGISCSYMTTYLICQYVEALCDLPATAGNTQTLNGNPVIRWLVNSMSYNSLCSANQINLRLLSEKSSCNLLTAQLVRYVTSPPLLRLKTISALSIYAAVGRDNYKLSVLPLPKSLKSSLHDIIFKEL